MSYCRCGDDSDVYVLCTGNGFEIHVSYNIDMPKKGESYLLDTHEETAQKLLQLRTEGYKIPKRAINRLLREINEGL